MKETHTYYFDLSLKETIRRHNTREKRHEFGEDSLQKWYNPHDTIEVTRETIFTDNFTQKDIFDAILNDDMKIRPTEYVSLIFIMLYSRFIIKIFTLTVCLPHSSLYFEPINTSMRLPLHFRYLQRLLLHNSTHTLDLMELLSIYCDNSHI